MGERWRELYLVLAQKHRGSDSVSDVCRAAARRGAGVAACIAVVLPALHSMLPDTEPVQAGSMDLGQHEGIHLLVPCLCAIGWPDSFETVAQGRVAQRGISVASPFTGCFRRVECASRDNQRRVICDFR